MDLGAKLRQARQEAGLSQRQLCGDCITRNMLSQIEHGTARPSMDTLQYLAAQLGKPVSWFLEEEGAVSPNQNIMDQARRAWSSGKPAEARRCLQAFRLPDDVLEWEWRYLSAVTTLGAAENALAEGRTIYARQLLEEMEDPEPLFPGLGRQRLLLLGRIPETDLIQLVKALPSLDGELLLRAEAARSAGAWERAAGLLSAAEDQESPRWNLLQGQVLASQQQYALAVSHLEAAEKDWPQIVWPLLEICFRETGDFRKAYEYACKQR